MALISCPDCGSPVSDAAPACVHCGRPMGARPEQPAPQPPGWGLRGAAVEGPFVAAPVQPAFLEVPVETSTVGELHPMAVHKLVLMSICTFGIYELFWFYRNWSRVRERTGRALSPFWRSVFAPLWGYSFFDEVEAQALAARIDPGWSPLVLGLLYFVLHALWRLPDPWWLVSFLSVLTLVPVQGTINELAARRGVRPDSSFQAKHVAVLVVGGICLLLALVGTFLPPE
jgi:hypothetical protein